MISAILIICLVSLTPLPSLPLVIYYYSKLGFLDGFIVVTVASNLKILIHYNLGKLVRSKKINLLNISERISKVAKKYKSIKMSIKYNIYISIYTCIHIMLDPCLFLAVVTP